MKIRKRNEKKGKKLKKGQSEYKPNLRRREEIRM